MEKCEPGENVNHGKKILKSVNQNYVNQNYVKCWFTVKKIIKVHIILVHENLNKNFKLSLKNGREPELCETWFTFSPGSHFPLVHTFPWFT
jgi:hypothetical protein